MALLIMADASRRPQFGNRLLEDPGKVFEHNAWDNVEWDAEQEEEARGKVQQNSQTPVAQEQQEQYESESDRFWDKFYTQHQNRFFKDRHWLFTEFPELAPKDLNLEDIPKRAHTRDSEGESAERLEPVIGDHCKHSETPSSQTSAGSVVTDSPAAGAGCSQPESCTETFPGQHSTTRILEVGCGVGNTVFPVLQTNNDPGLFVYCCDLSPTAIELVKEHPDYTEKRCHAFVCNVADPASSTPIPEASLDIVILIFVLSAIHPDKFQDTITRLAKLLKPGGLMVLRDYGRYDLAQLRFKDGHCLSENFYVRGDGTRVYFFTQEELREIFIKAGLVEEQNYIDRRLQVNRGRQLKMYRVWIQCKYKKPTQRDISEQVE